MKFPRERRLTLSADFRRVREKGRSAAGAYLVMGVLEAGGDGLPRVGFITSKRVGGAVVRNRVRRRLRAIVREAGGRIRNGCHVVLVARVRAGKVPSAKLEKEFFWLAKKMGVLADGG